MDINSFIERMHRPSRYCECCAHKYNKSPERNQALKGSSTEKKYLKKGIDKLAYKRFPEGIHS